MTTPLTRASAFVVGNRYGRLTVTGLAGKSGGKAPFDARFLEQGLWVASVCPLVETRA